MGSSHTRKEQEGEAVFQQAQGKRRKSSLEGKQGRCRGKRGEEGACAAGQQMVGTKQGCVHAP